MKIAENVEMLEITTEREESFEAIKKLDTDSIICYHGGCYK